MAFHIYTSNRVEELSTIFCDKVKNRNKWNEVANIIIQTKGLEKWLVKQAAKSNGIFANYEFSNPDGFIWKLHFLVENYSNSYFTSENMKWKLFSFLKENAFVKQFKTIANYYYNDDIKRIQLAGKMADLFEQYLVYRPQYITAWNKGKSVNSKNEDFTKHEEWQKYLWLKLKEDSKEQLDCVELKDRLLKKMDEAEFQTLLKEKFPSLHLFGIAVLSNYHKEIYEKLSSIIDVFLYISSPSETKGWYDITAQNQENELLGSCKELSATLHRLLPMKDAHQLYSQPIGDILLSTLQRDIYYNHNKEIQNYDIKQVDDSVRVVSSYTPVREVEALYNHLLNEFEKNPDLKGSDVSVQLCDVEAYAPLIKAVFDNAPKLIPYNITDTSYADGDSLIKALELFMSLPYSNFKAENVLHLFDFQAVRKRFNIQDIELVRELVAGANIRYGIEGNQEDETYLFSWKHGLSKLILGYAIKGGGSYHLDDTEFFPCDAMEGTDALTIFKIKAFADTIFELHEEAHKERSINEWKDFILDKVFKSLFDIDDSYEDEQNYTLAKLEHLSSITKNTNDKISFQVFQEGLIALLNSETTNSTYTSGLVTFSSIIPVRSIPFKIIAVLGLNSGDFPRQQKKLGFDLMAIEPMENDRNIKNNDKYLFLESLLSAREQIYLSYIGSSIKDNSDLPPSLPVEELEEYLIRGTGNKKWFDEKIKYKYPLHSSSDKYFTGDKFFTYLGQEKLDLPHESVVTPSAENQELSFDEINLNDLISFYKDPFKWYYNKTLRIYYSDDAILLPDEEPFELDNLQKWALKKDLVQLSSHDEEAYIKRKKNDGLIQLANMAKAELIIEEEEIEDIKKEYIERVSGEAQNIAINLKFDNSVLKGTIDNVFNEGYVHYNVSKDSSQAKYLMETFIKHLAYKACVDDAKSLYISSSYVFPIPNNFIDANTAKKVLSKLIEYYKKGHEEIITFCPAAGLTLMDLIQVKAKPQDRETAIKNATEKFWYKKQYGEIDYLSSYIEKEASLGYFKDLLADEKLSKKEQEKLTKKQDTLYHLSELLFSKLSTLISTL